MYNNRASCGVSVQTVGSNPYVNVKFSTSGPAYPVVSSSTPRRFFISTPPSKVSNNNNSGTTNLSDLLPEQLRSTSVASSTSSDVWSRRSSLSFTPNQVKVAPTTTTTRRRRRTKPSVTSQPAQNTRVSRSRTPQSQAKPAAQWKVQKVKCTGLKRTQKTQKPQKQTKADKINEIVQKGKKAGQLSNGVWFKTPKGFKPVSKPASKRPAFKKQKAVRRTATATSTVVVPSISPETQKAIKKLRKKVKQCAKIQEKVRKGMRVEVNELEKLNQLDDFKKQLAVLETRSWKVVN